MAEDSSNPLKDAVTNNSKWVDKVLWGGLILAGTIVLLKLNNKTSFEWVDIEFNTHKAWLILSLFTLAHLYTTWLLIRAIIRFWTVSSEAECQATFAKVTSSGGLLVRGLIPRTERVRNLYKMKWSDPTTIVSHLAALLLIPAIVPFDFSDQTQFYKYLGIAVAVMIINWLIGSSWAVALSQLTVKHDEAYYLLRLARRKN